MPFEVGQRVKLTESPYNDGSAVGQAGTVEWVWDYGTPYEVRLDDGALVDVPGEWLAPLS